MITLKEMRKTAKEKGFKFDVYFLGWVYGERRYTLETSTFAYYSINYDDVRSIFNKLKED